MPPIRKKDPLKSAQIEGKIQLAISDLKNGRILNIREATRIYDIPRTTLRDRLKGIEYKGEKRANHHKLTQSEEDSLVKWVLDLDRRGLPPRHSLVREMVNYLLLQHGKPQVGKNWVTNLIKRRPEIDSKFARKYNYERAKCEDPKIIQEHFDRVRDAISEYGILPEDIYNFDETGFAMGLCATAKVITGSDRYARPKLLQPGNREWVTAIEATNSTGWAIPYINGRSIGSYRMLILDGHGSHLTAEFDRTCTENNIIPICMPPHSSHLLQPLDVGCFAVLKRHYGQQVEQRMRDGFNHIDKLDFLMAFPKARTEAYKARTIQNSFVATGLVPFNPDRMHDLRAANEKEKQKRQKSKKQISIEQGITREEVQALVQGQIEASQAVTTAPAEPGLPAPQAVVVLKGIELIDVPAVLVVRFLYIFLYGV
ncbi:conserved hypothetical protein [Talaromyces marneffei ATCC 18224]|uniref:HTH CENPB-type domain-containing protein n=1 Tax=Talaromyces marneffei (strain ATCC 18224 / CBS 334.59 / QM 7333) TaxID=441960 RepID=B6QHY5_TALMQ|nr:conserved hypothetical protein [Talaromyces marneffei ATCC 18224]